MFLLANMWNVEFLALSIEGRLGVPGNKGTWPKLKRNTGTSSLNLGSGINLKNISKKLRGTRGFSQGNWGTWPKLKGNTGTSSLNLGSGINLKNVSKKLRGTR